MNTCSMHHLEMQLICIDTPLVFESIRTQPKYEYMYASTWFHHTLPWVKKITYLKLREFMSIRKDNTKHVSKPLSYQKQPIKNNCIQRDFFSKQMRSDPKKCYFTPFYCKFLRCFLFSQNYIDPLYKSFVFTKQIKQANYNANVIVKLKNQKLLI